MNMKKFSTLVFAVVLLTAALCNVASAISPFKEPNAADTEWNNPDIDLPVQDQKLVMEAIRASDLTASEKKDLIKHLRAIWSGRSDLSETEQTEVLHTAAVILHQHLGIHQSSDVSIQWNWYPHADLARTAGEKWGVRPEYVQVLYDEANTPDSWFRYPGDHFWYGSWGYGPYYTERYADEARSYLSSRRSRNQAEGYRRLGWSIHYMSDLANPWHTVLLFGQAYHGIYENYVGDNWYGGKNFYGTVQNDWYYYEITDPEASAKNMAAVSNQYIEFLVGEIVTDPDWRNDPAVVSDTRTVLTHAIRYDVGLIDYATRREGRR